MSMHSRFSQKSIKLALMSALALAGATVAGNSVAAAATASATSQVVAPIAITKGADLAFGKFAAGTGGSVTVSTSGARTASGAVLMTSTPSAARFDVTGEGSNTYSISFTGTSTTLISGANNMAFATTSDLTGANTVAGNVSTGTLTAGAQSLYVGGTLSVGATQAAGTYSGSVVATVEYN